MMDKDVDHATDCSGEPCDGFAPAPAVAPEPQFKRGDRVRVVCEGSDLRGTVEVAFRHCRRDYYRVRFDAEAGGGWDDVLAGIVFPADDPPCAPDAVVKALAVEATERGKTQAAARDGAFEAWWDEYQRGERAVFSRLVRQVARAAWDGCAAAMLAHVRAVDAAVRLLEAELARARAERDHWFRKATEPEMREGRP